MSCKIDQIEVFTLKLPHHYRVGGHVETPNRLPGTNYYIEPQWRHAYSCLLESCIVKITADDGVVGWGEAQAPLTPETTCSLITTLLGPALIGQDPSSIDELYDRLYYLMLARGHTGSFISDAMAGLDIALWDLNGRRAGEPLFDLLGGARTTELPAYISGLRVQGLDAKIEHAKSLCELGFVGVKLFTGDEVESTREEVREIRSAIGDDAFLAVDAICKYELTDAMKLGHTLDEHCAAWFEAPLNAEDVEGHRALARSIATPIAVGETLRTERQFEPWLRAHALEVAQPDTMRCGLTGALRIASLAKTAGVPTALHVGVCTHIGMASTWHLAAHLAETIPQEHQHELFEAAGKILEAPLKVKNGKLIVPQKPGLGIEVSESAINASSTEHWIVNAQGRRLAAQAT